MYICIKWNIQNVAMNILFLCKWYIITWQSIWSHFAVTGMSYGVSHDFFHMLYLQSCFLGLVSLRWSENLKAFVRQSEYKILLDICNLPAFFQLSFSTYHGSISIILILTKTFIKFSSHLTLFSWQQLFCTNIPFVYIPFY